MQKLEKKKAKDRALVKKLTSTEPEWGHEQTSRSLDEQTSAIRMAFNYYNMAWDSKQRRAAFKKHLAHNHIELDLAHISDDQINGTMVAIGRMRDLGCVFTNSSLAYYKMRFDELTEAVNILGRDVSGSTTTKTSVPTIQDRVAAQLSVYIGAWEAEIDKRLNSVTHTFNATAWLQEHNVKPMYAKGLAEWFQVQATEIRSVIDKTDSQLVEAYSFFRKDLKSYNDFVQGMVDAANAWADVMKRAKIPKTREKKVSTQIKHIKYQATDTALGLTSIDPTKIIGATSLWLYNTKSRMLAIYYAKDADGLSLTGTTIKNFTAESGMKKMRKPKEILPLILRGKRLAEKTYETIRAKHSVFNGRINQHTILLSVR